MTSLERQEKKKENVGMSELQDGRGGQPTCLPRTRFGFSHSFGEMAYSIIALLLLLLLLLLLASIRRSRTLHAIKKKKKRKPRESQFFFLSRVICCAPTRTQVQKKLRAASKNYTIQGMSLPFPRIGRIPSSLPPIPHTVRQAARTRSTGGDAQIKKKI
jgi:hypothetical protein